MQFQGKYRRVGRASRRIVRIEDTSTPQHQISFFQRSVCCFVLEVTIQNPLTIFNRPVAEYMNDEESDHQSIMIDEAHRAQDALQVDVRARYSGTPIDTGYQAQQAQHDTQSHALQVLFVTRVLVSVTT